MSLADVSEHALTFLRKGGDRVRAECSCGWVQLAVDETAAHELAAEHVTLAGKHTELAPRHLNGLAVFGCRCGWKRERFYRAGHWPDVAALEAASTVKWVAHYDEVVVNA